MDIVQIPGYPGLFTRRVVVEMWQRAGSPPINDAGRLYSTQKAAWNAYQNGTGSPADNPDRPDIYPLAHVRFAALDVVNSARGAMTAAGFEYPYSYEPWHAQLPNIYAYPLVDSIPASAFLNVTPIIPQEDEMSYAIRVNSGRDRYNLSPGFIAHINDTSASELTKNIVTADDKWIDLSVSDFVKQLDAFGVPRDKVDIANGRVFDVRFGDMVKGGMWSWAREAAQNANPTQVLDAIADVKASLPKA